MIPSRTLHFRSLFVAYFGNFLEYYDYALFGFLAPVVATTFFPASQPEVGLIQSFGVFALASVAKPLGAFIFGRLGDERGRKRALQINMLGIGVTTGIMALIPGYDTWGLLSPLSLVMLRLLQGIFLGGEIDGTRIYVLEKSPPERQCWANSLSSLTSSLGVSAAGLLVGLSLVPGLPSNGIPFWRGAVALGAVLSFVLFFLRRFLTETSAFEKVARKRYPASWPLVKSHFPITMAIFLLGGSIGGLYHFYGLFLPTFYGKLMGSLPLADASRLFSEALLFYTALVPVVGFFSDKIPKKIIFLGGLMGLGMMSLWGLGNPLSLASWSLLGPLMVALAFFNVPAYVMLLERVPVRGRYRLFGLGHSLGALAFSSSAPLWSTTLWEFCPQPWGPFLYPLLLVSLGIVAYVLMRRVPPVDLAESDAHSLPS